MNASTAARRLVTGFDHVTIGVGDADVATRFYVHVLGGELVRGPRGPAIWFGARPLLELAVDDEARAAPRASVGLTIRPDDMLCTREMLRARGVPTHGPWRNGPPGHVSIDFLDPFGNSVQLATMGFQGEAIDAPPDRAELEYAWTSLDLSLPAVTPNEAGDRRRRSPRVSSRRLIQ